MENMSTGFIIAIGVAVVLLLFFIGIYNGLVAGRIVLKMPTHK